MTPFWCHSGVMQITPHVEELQRQLVGATAGTPGHAEAERLALALDAAARLAILDALSEAAGEITRELAPGSVDLRLRGRDVEFVVATPRDDEPATALTSVDTRPAPADEQDDASTSRVSLRLPEALKSRAEAAAARDGVSLNSWLVRAVGAALEPRPAVRESHGSSFTGWVR